METYQGTQTFTPSSTEEWRAWLEENHDRLEAVWVIFYKKGSGIPSITWSEAVDEALCFGWIDSKPNKRDEASYYRFFSRRNPKSNWSKINKEKVKNLLADGRMNPAGLEMVKVAKESGTWDALNKVDNLIVPEDLQELFNQNLVALRHWENFPPSSKKIILEWILNAKTDKTRLKRITETVENAAENIRANHHRP